MAKNIPHSNIFHCVSKQVSLTKVQILVYHSDARGINLILISLGPVSKNIGAV